MKYTKEELENEKWRDVVGYEGLYKVSDLGRIYSISSNKLLFECKTNDGYIRNCLTKNGGQKLKRFHRIVAESFIPNPDKLPQVNHIDGDKSNNRVNNLEWVTAKENIDHAVKLGLIKSGGNYPHSKSIYCYDLYGRFIREYDSATDFCIENEISKSLSSNIRCVCLGKYQSFKGYMFKYKKDCPDESNIKPHFSTVAKISKGGHILDVYENTNIAAKSNNLFKSSIIKVCNNKQKTSGGFIWSYLKDLWNEKKF